MNVLVCDDDAAARFVASRWLTKTLGCVVTSCDDGVEALKLLAESSFDLAIIDLELPRLGGIEVVEAIRASAQTRDLPVVVLSQERREVVVRNLLALGVSAYLLKPLRERAVVGRIAPLLASRRPLRAADTQSDARLTPDSPALLVDGDANFCHTFSSVAAPFGPLMSAESAADALALFRKTPTAIVFVGQALGIVGVEALARKLRESSPEGVRLVGIGVTDSHAHRRLFDDVMPRVFVTDVLTEALRPFVFLPGPLSRFEQLAPRFSECLKSAVVQVFGMMGGLEVGVAAEPVASPAVDGVVSTIVVDVNGQYALDLSLALPDAVIRDLSTRMLGVDGSEVDEEALTSTASELANMIGGRLDAWLKGRALASKCALPETRPATGDDWVSAPSATDAAGAWFTMPETSQGFRLAWRAREYGV